MVVTFSMLSFNENQTYFRKLIVNHYSNPTHKGFTNMANSLTYHQASASCADDFQVEIVINNQIINSARFIGFGCAIATAAIDIFCELIENKTIAAIKLIIANYQAMLNQAIFKESVIGQMIAFKNVPRQRNRIKCALIGIEGINKLLLMEQ